MTCCTTSKLDILELIPFIKAMHTAVMHTAVKIERSKST
jgi:hypothetical protein